MDISVNDYLFLSTMLFVVGLFGMLLNRSNIIYLLMSLELILLSVNLNFVAFSTFLQYYTGQIFVIFILSVTATEVAVGLALLVLLFKNNNTISPDVISKMKG
jgi:NADH-quinone oxidoreductase subunit K